MRATTPLFLLLSVLVSISPAVEAQTYFYMSQIAVVPASPTVQDNVQLQLIGDLSNTGASITSATAQITGFTVSLAVEATSAGGLEMLVPHTEVVNSGVLPAGDYTITISGSGVQDMAPQDQHHFTVSGGASACDPLVLAGLTWMPFSDTALVVHVFNPTAALFDHPGFLLLANNGDTLAKETVNLSGLAQESYNILSIPPGTIMPASPFDATLQLWTDHYQDLGCTWDLPVNLCPPDSCTPVILDIRNSGSGLATGSFSYTVREGGTTVASGSFELTDAQQVDQDTVCLAPGHYLMEIIPDQGPNGGQLQFGVDLAQMLPGPHVPVIWTTLSAIAFTLYDQCIDIEQGIASSDPDLLSIMRTANGIEVVRSDGRALGDMKVFDAQGRILVTVKEATARHDFIMADEAPGVYILQAVNKDGKRLTARWVVE